MQNDNHEPAAALKPFKVGSEGGVYLKYGSGFVVRPLPNIFDQYLYPFKIFPELPLPHNRTPSVVQWWLSRAAASGPIYNTNTKEDPVRITVVCQTDEQAAAWHQFINGKLEDYAEEDYEPPARIAAVNELCVFDWGNVADHYVLHPGGWVDYYEPAPNYEPRIID